MTAARNDGIEGEGMYRDREERDDDRREQREDRSSGDKRFPIRIRATFIRLDRSPREEASAA